MSIFQGNEAYILYETSSQKVFLKEDPQGKCRVPSFFDFYQENSSYKLFVHIPHTTDVSATVLMCNFSVILSETSTNQMNSITKTWNEFTGVK